MMTPTAADTALYKRHRYPTEIISPAVWLYFRFSLSYRDVEELLAARGIVVTYETVRQWCRKFGSPALLVKRVRMWYNWCYGSFITSVGDATHSAVLWTTCEPDHAG